MIRELDLKTLRLAKGSHASIEDGACVMEAVAYVAGEPWSDHPACASPAITGFLVDWNDALGDAERQMLTPLIPRIIGTRTTRDDETRRARLAADWLVRSYAPAWLDLAGLADDAAALRGLPELMSTGSTRAAWPIVEEVRERLVLAESAAWSAAESTAESAAWWAAWLAARSAAESAAWSTAESAAWSAARSAARWAAESAAWSAAESAARSAAESAAESALAPTVRALQASALDLVERMIAVGRADETTSPVEA